MTQIEKITDGPDPEVGGQTYQFHRDTKGRFVAEVSNLRHVECFLSVADHYRRVPDDDIAPPAPEPQQAQAAEETKDEIPVEQGSDNVFSDLGLGKEGETAEESKARLDAGVEPATPPTKPSAKTSGKPQAKKPGAKTQEAKE